MDKRRPKCFHNGIILIVNSFQFDWDKCRKIIISKQNYY